MSLALYIHIPFCVRKCAYCDFASGPASGIRPEEYMTAVVTEMARRAGLLDAPPEAATLYFGGGTPSLLTPELIGAVITAAREQFNLCPDAEITLEANPGTVTPEALAGYRRGGVNRLSLGIQSFHAEMLTLLGRVHTGEEARTAFQWARNAGFDNVGIDLIHSLPGQTADTWREQMAQAVVLNPEHISAYGLTVEDGTLFSRLQEEGKLSLPDEETAAGLYQVTGQVLAVSGYEQYEIANFAKPGRRSRHNQVYWQRGSYLGFGAAAHSFLPGKESPFGRRWRNPLDPSDYLRAITSGTLPEEEVTILSRQDAMAETLFLGLRTADGVDVAHFLKTFGEGINDVYGEEVRSLLNSGLLRQESGRLIIPADRLILSNQVLQRFL